MATVSISDIYDPTLFKQLVDEKEVSLNRFKTSGVAVTNTAIDEMSNIGGRIGELPFYNPLGSTEPNYSDDSSDNATPNKITTGTQIFRKAIMNQAWSAMDIARELALKDPVDAITSKIAQYWATVNEKRIIYSCVGIINDNVANDSNDMVHDIGTDATGTPSDSELISGEAVIDAKATMGDHADGLTVMAVHSVPFTRLQKLNLIDYIPDSEGKVQIPTYMGMTLVVDDNLPAVAGSNRIKYTSILYGVGAFASSTGNPTVPFEVERNALKGKGGGETVIVSRRTDIIHPFGWAFTSSSVSGETPTLTELSTTANWNRVYSERKNANMAFLITNG